MKISRSLLTSASALTMVFGLAACGSGSSSGSGSTSASTDGPPITEAVATSPSGSDAVGISSSRFEPTELMVAVGDTVTFTNNDPFAHTVTSKDDSAISFDSGKIGKGETFTVEFTEAGTFNYFCQIHPTMRATVTVG
jgi:plastocyanin